MRAILRVSLLVLLTIATATAQEPAKYPQISVTAGRSTVVTTTFDVTRIAITNPAIADAVVVRPREILVDGKGPGTIYTPAPWKATLGMRSHLADI